MLSQMLCKLAGAKFSCMLCNKSCIPVMRNTNVKEPRKISLLPVLVCGRVGQEETIARYRIVSKQKYLSILIPYSLVVSASISDYQH